MTSDNDKKAAEEHGRRRAERESENYRYDWIDIQEAATEGFEAGCEHKQKELEQIKEQIANEYFNLGVHEGVTYMEMLNDNREALYPEFTQRLKEMLNDEDLFNWQQKNKGEG